MSSLCSISLSRVHANDDCLLFSAVVIVKHIDDDYARCGSEHVKRVRGEMEED